MATRRPDLENMEVNPLFNYVGARLMPVMKVPQKVGDFYYQSVDADVSAQTNRSAGSAPTTATLSSSSKAFTCAEAIYRIQVDTADSDLVAGSKEDSLAKCARVGMRSIQRAQEAAIVTAVTALTTEAYGNRYDILDSFRETMDTGIDFVHRVPGKLALVLGWTTYRRLTRYSEVTNALLRTGVITEREVGQMYQVAPPALASVIGVDEVIVGDDDHWTAGIAFLAKLPDPSMDPVEVPQIGRTSVYWPSDATSMFKVEAFDDDQLRTFAVDVSTWYVCSGLDYNGIFQLRGIDEGNANTTTTSTTT